MTLKYNNDDCIYCNLDCCGLVDPDGGHIFCLFSSQDNKLDFMEYVSALHLVLRGKLEDRLKWSFKMYDTDGNGRLDRREVRRLLRVRAKITVCLIRLALC